MTQIITGPFGRVAYHSTEGVGAGQYPALNLPCTAFAHSGTYDAANETSAPGVIELARYMRPRTSRALYGAVAKREN